MTSAHQFVQDTRSAETVTSASQAAAEAPAVPEETCELLDELLEALREADDALGNSRKRPEVETHLCRIAARLETLREANHGLRAAAWYWRRVAERTFAGEIRTAGNRDARGITAVDCEHLVLRKPSAHAVSLIFGLTRASWITLPRVLMQAMPPLWQSAFAQLMDDYSTTFPKQPVGHTQVTMIDPRTNRFMATPEWLLDYRHPNRAAIDQCRIGESENV